MKSLTWNLEWAAARSKRFEALKKRVLTTNPDVACFTEVNVAFLPAGYLIEADPDYGYPIKEGRRKVVLWSRSPWSDIEVVGDPELPQGRFVSGITQGIRFVGVCIPWRDAHVRTGRKDRSPWEDHLAYCRRLKRIISCYSAKDEPICILGDFNQRIPRSRQPEKVYEALTDAIPDLYQVSTAGIKDDEDKNLIDHIVVSSSLRASNVEVLSRFTSDGTRLSDHVGVVADIALENCESA